MQLSVSTGKHGILQRATFLTFGDSLDHTADYPLADMVASANRWVQAVGLWIWRVSGTWEFDDSNYTTLPFATTNLVNNQQDYALPTTALALRRVEVRDANGIWSQLTQMDASEVGGALLEQGKIAGLPRHYDVVGNSLMLYPRPAAASVTLVGGLRMQVDRESLTFSVPASYITADPTRTGFEATIPAGLRSITLIPLPRLRGVILLVAEAATSTIGITSVAAGALAISSSCPILLSIFKI